MNFELDQPGEGRAANVKYDAASRSYSLFYPCQSQSICTSYKADLKAGRYLLEVWGSQGGSYGGEGGKGGYSRGILSLEQTTLLFFTIGGRSSTKEINGFHNSDESFNSGGKSGFSSNGLSGSPGGGGTDIRALINDFSHRILVSSGGGGGGQWGSSLYRGGFGGGEIGGDGIKQYSGYPGSKGGNQNSGGIGGSYSGYLDQSGGEFGQGSSTVYRGSGGGGGWYGGSAGYEFGSSGGGGSGYVNNATSIKPSSYPFKSSFFLEEGFTEGNNNSNLGFIKITILFAGKDQHFQDKCPPNNNLLNFLISHYFLSCFLDDSHSL